MISERSHALQTCIHGVTPYLSTQTDCKSKSLFTSYNLHHVLKEVAEGNDVYFLR